MVNKKLIFILMLFFMASSVNAATSPLILYTDAISGPISGGENNLGTYLSIFGRNFGSASGLGTITKVYIGNVEVANYRYLGPAAVSGKLDIQQITVQVGALGNPILGQALPVRVEVNGIASNTDNTFTPNPGRILFVSLSGDDATAVVNDITRPWRYLQTPTRGGAYATLRAGDHIVIRGGDWSDTGFDGAWLRFWDTNQMGSAPTGISGTGWIHFTAYPGPINGNAIEDVHYSTPANFKGGIHGANSVRSGLTGEYVSISNLRMDVNALANSDAAPINIQYSRGNWRAVNNALGPWPSTLNNKAGGVAGGGNNVKIFGNHIYGISGSSALENHGVYVDSAGGTGSDNWEIGYNYIHDITGGNLIQIYDSVGGLVGSTNMQIHDNWLENANKYGLNLAYNFISGKIWNNVIIGARYAGLRIDVCCSLMDITIAFNTFYNNDRVVSGGSSQILNSWGAYSPTGTIRIYDNIFAAGNNTLTTSRYYMNYGAYDAYLDFKRNLYFDNNYGWAPFSLDTTGIFSDPEFVGAASNDIHIGLNSPAVDSATQPIPFTLSDDFTSIVSRPQGSFSDIGAYEYVSSAPLQTCLALGGSCCSLGQTCQGGSFQSSSDCSSLCCVGGTCITPSPPTITILSPSNTTYNLTSVVLSVTADKSITTWNFSNNTQSNIVFNNNMTLNVTQGSNILTVCGSDGTFMNCSRLVFAVAPFVPSPSLPTCQLTSALWSTTSTTEGNVVSLNLQGTDCDGKSVSFVVWEDDLIGDDPVITNPVNAVFSGNTATGSWTAEWQDDALTDPEYYFIASLTTNLTETITSSNQLIVSKGAVSSICPSYALNGNK